MGMVRALLWPWKCELTHALCPEIMRTERMSVYVLSILNSLDSNVVVNINTLLWPQLHPLKVQYVEVLISIPSEYVCIWKESL